MVFLFYLFDRSIVGTATVSVIPKGEVGPLRSRIAS